VTYRTGPTWRTARRQPAENTVPTAAELAYCVSRILETKDLWPELKALEFDVDQFAFPIALARHNERRYDAALARQIATRKKSGKLVYTYLEREKKGSTPRSHREGSRKTFVAALLDMSITTEQTIRDRGLPPPVELDDGEGVAPSENHGERPSKRRPYLERLFVILHCTLAERTDEPYKYLAGLFNLFNLRGMCLRCPGFDKIPGKCKHPGVFDCISHETVRQSLWRIGRRRPEKDASPLEEQSRALGIRINHVWIQGALSLVPRWVGLTLTGRQVGSEEQADLLRQIQETSIQEKPLRRARLKKS
jgi:hypothetical protein